jgi:hypothetical protein
MNGVTAAISIPMACLVGAGAGFLANASHSSHHAAHTERIVAVVLIFTGFAVGALGIVVVNLRARRTASRD